MLCLRTIASSVERRNAMFGLTDVEIFVGLWAVMFAASIVCQIYLWRRGGRD